MTLTDLLKLSDSELKQRDIGAVNLVVGAGLAGTNSVSLAAGLETLDQWSSRVQRTTEQHLPRFRRNPAEFENSEAYFRMLVLATVLQRDLAVKYHAGLVAEPTEKDLRSGEFYRDAGAVFLHGLLGERREGTCASMPVLYAAVGRRLGYPLKLVRTKGHLFLRWEGEGRNRLNIECSAKGLVCHPDEHYRRWPFIITDAEVKEEGYLRSLTPVEELAEFLTNRACCLAAAGEFKQARECLEHAARLVPQIPRFRLALTALNQPQP
jgi:tetratricopeptide (TPR) repeat protein